MGEHIKKRLEMSSMIVITYMFTKEFASMLGIISDFFFRKTMKLS